MLLPSSPPGNNGLRFSRAPETGSGNRLPDVVRYSFRYTLTCLDRSPCPSLLAFEKARSAGKFLVWQDLLSSLNAFQNIELTSIFWDTVHRFDVTLQEDLRCCVVY